MAVQATWGRGYWLSDMSVQCFTGAHLRWAGFLGIPLVLVTGLGIPLISLSVLLYHRKKLDQTKVRMKYGFIYQPYRYACCCGSANQLVQFLCRAVPHCAALCCVALCCAVLCYAALYMRKCARACACPTALFQ